MYKIYREFEKNNRDVATQLPENKNRGVEDNQPEDWLDPK